MRITATVRNSGQVHSVAVSTQGSVKSIGVPAKAAGGGSAVNGGEFLMLALATCYCNDLYREAQRLGLELQGVEIEASADFLGVGLAASNVQYRANLDSPEPAKRLEQLLRETDAVAEVHNTLRVPTQVTLVPWSQAP